MINVLRGEMSLVGPRPCLDWEAEMFPEEFSPRFTVRPGLTGLWQVSGRSSLALDMLPARCPLRPQPLTAVGPGNPAAHRARPAAQRRALTTGSVEPIRVQPLWGYPAVGKP